ncbi:hypothetical protein M422DRAFT_260694 [Sphaerobolus stellatus SS14]|uniref:Unplaced genomic scaffold SPHSTscaffold_99, whole genome shotgun sequence n=1 Tax=Sphaerobolus stellatus (strain SS14) TaxID=990650 RepID=A0A0C9VHN9_SPHS4|nr:hypothetical protein M422DRAFT_260694 [Sphaerobolus stellatus SS14]
MLDTVLDALLGATVVKAFVEELEPWRNDRVAEFVKASGGKDCRQVALFEYRNEDASTDVEEADAMQQPRNKRRVAVRLSLDPTSRACDSTSDTVTSLDVAETLHDLIEEEPFFGQCHLRRDGRQRGLGAFHCPMSVEHRTHAEIHLRYANYRNPHSCIPLILVQHTPSGRPCVSHLADNRASRGKDSADRRLVSRLGTFWSPLTRLAAAVDVEATHLKRVPRDSHLSACYWLVSITIAEMDPC